MRFSAVLVGAGVLALLLAVTLFNPGSFPLASANDDHGNTRSTGTSITIGSDAVSGNIDAGLLPDKDYFRFSAQRGVRYTFTLDMLTVESAGLAVINSSARGPGLAEEQVVTQSGRRKSVEWVARSTDTYFVEVGGVRQTQGGPVHLGSYQLSSSHDIRLKDRYPQTSAQATALQVGYKYEGAISPWPASRTGFSGGIEGDYDQDYFYVQARRGIQYTFSAQLDGLQAIEISVEDDTNVLLKSNGGRGSSLVWVAPEHGRYYVSLTGSRSFPGTVGPYVLEVSADESLEDIHSPFKDSATVVVPGNQIQGAISPEGDEDYFTFRSKRGIQYQIGLVLSGENGDNASITVYDRNGGLQKTNNGVGVSLEWTPATSADFLVLIKGSPLDRNPVRSYVLQVTSNENLEDRHMDTLSAATQARLSTPQSGAISPPDDKDYFYFEALRGAGYVFNIHSGTVEGISLSLINAAGDVEETTTDLTTPLQWVAPNRSKYYVLVESAPGIANVIGPYSFTIMPDLALEDRHGDSHDQATPATLGAPHLAAISPPDDQDHFSFKAKRGIQYTFTVESDSLSGVNVTVAGPSGEVELSNKGLGNSLVWIAPEDGTYYLAISNTGLLAKAVGAYSLMIDASTDFEDLHGETKASATEISFEITYPGALSPAQDKDYFSFRAKRGVSYKVDAGPDAAISIAIYDGRDVVQARNTGLTSSLDWTAPDDGRYYLALSDPLGVTEGISSYSLRILVEEATEDKHSEEVYSATRIIFGNRLGGAVSPEDDQDRFSFSAVRGVLYTFELTYGTAKAVSLTVGSRARPDTALASNYGEDTTVTWLAPANGNYIVTISSAPQVENPMGTYSLKVTGDESLMDQHSNAFNLATEISLGNTVGGSISPSDDIDAFKFYAQQGSTYLVKVHTISGPAVRFAISNPNAALSKSQYGAGEIVMLTSPATGSYHVEVSAATPGSSAASKYQVTVAEDLFAPKVDTLGTHTSQLSPVVSSLTLGLEHRVAPRGSTIRVPVVLRNASDLRNLAFGVNYDPAKLEVLDVEAGFLSLGGSLQYNTDDPGMVRLGYAGSDPVNGDGQIAVVTFRVITQSDGSTTLSPALGIATNSENRLLFIEMVDGQLTIGPRPLGDGSGDGLVSALDALIALKMANGLQEIDLALDVDGDSQVSNHDALQILTLAGAGQEV